MGWQTVLEVALGSAAWLGFAYRVYRVPRGGPLGDAAGQALLGLVLAGLALAVADGIGWARWVALGYGILFGAVVMPVWVMAVLIPMSPRWPDYAFTGLYWAALLATVVAALAL